MAHVRWELELYDDIADTIIQSAKEIGVKQLSGVGPADNILDWDGTALEAYDDMVKVRTEQGGEFSQIYHFQKG